jgi:hypothetical protein
MKSITAIIYVISAFGSLLQGTADESIPLPDVDIVVPDLNFGSIEELEAGLSQGFIAPNFEGWIKECDHVDVVVYDGSDDPDQPLIKNEKFNQKYSNRMIKRLDTKEVELLKRCLIGKHKPTWQFMCFDPHHAFVFYDKNSKIIGHIEICFDCRTFRSYPKSGLSEYWDLTAIKKLVVAKGLPDFDSSEEWKKYFIELHASSIPQNNSAESGPRE